MIRDTSGDCLGTNPVVENISWALAESLRDEAALGNNAQSFATSFRDHKTTTLCAFAAKVSKQDLKQSLIRIGDNCISSARLTERVAKAAGLLDNVETVRLLIEVLLHEIADPTQLGELLYVPSELLSLLAATMEMFPETVYRVIGHPSDDPMENPLYSKLSQQMPELATTHNTFTGRQASLIIMSYLRRVTPAVCNALHSAMLDVPDVQQVALESIQRYRYIDTSSIYMLNASLAHSSNTMAYMAGRLMSSLARNKFLEADLYPVIEMLRKAAERTEKGREVYLFESTNFEDYRITCIGKLSNLFLDMVDDLTGVSNFSDKISSNSH